MYILARVLSDTDYNRREIAPLTEPPGMEYM